jgi:transcriptional regulator with XRE-family HTH domain
MYPNLKLAMFRRGLQQNRVSKTLGLNEANLSKIIHGYREPSEAQKKLLANYLEADEAWLFEEYNCTSHQTGSNSIPEKETEGSEST